MGTVVFPTSSASKGIPLGVPFFMLVCRNNIFDSRGTPGYKAVVDLTALREALALSRELITTSKFLISESKRIREQSHVAIEESQIVLDKAKRLKEPDAF